MQNFQHDIAMRINAPKNLDQCIIQWCIFPLRVCVKNLFENLEMLYEVKSIYIRGKGQCQNTSPST